MVAVAGRPVEGVATEDPFLWEGIVWEISDEMVGVSMEFGGLEFVIEVLLLLMLLMP